MYMCFLLGAENKLARVLFSEGWVVLVPFR
jgi:hypothetical protein